MLLLSWVLAVWLLLVVLMMWAGTPGVFQGEVVSAPHGQPSVNWLYLRARRGAVRRVGLAAAKYHYADGVHAAVPAGPQALSPGATVRVEAEQDNGGEWQAKQVEILAPPPTAPSESSPKSP